MEISFNNIYNYDCIDGMKSISKNKIDLVITDPPFAIDFKAKKSQISIEWKITLFRSINNFANALRAGRFGHMRKTRGGIEEAKFQ